MKNPQGSRRCRAPSNSWRRNLQSEIKTIDRTYFMRSSLFAFIFTHNYRTSSLLFISIIITIPPMNKKTQLYLSKRCVCVCASLYFTSTLYHYHALKLLTLLLFKTVIIMNDKHMHYYTFPRYKIKYQNRQLDSCSSMRLYANKARVTKSECVVYTQMRAKIKGTR